MSAKSIAKRASAIVVALLPVALHVASAASAYRSKLALVGEAFAMIAMLLGSLDFYVSFVRRKMPRVSPAPFVGAVLVVAAGALAFGDRPTAIFALFAYVIDTGGPAWFIAATWRDRSMWG